MLPGGWHLAWQDGVHDLECVANEELVVVAGRTPFCVFPFKEKIEPVAGHDAEHLLRLVLEYIHS